MAEVHLQCNRTRSIWFQCLPDEIYRSELLDGAGDIKRKNMMADLEAKLGPDSPMLAQFDEMTPPQGPRYVVVHFGGSGVIDIRIRTHDAEPPLELDDWETIEQAGAEFGELEATAELDESVTKITDPGLDRLMQQIDHGWNMIRVHSRGFRPRKPGGAILIDIWPITAPFNQEHIKHQPATPVNPKVPPGFGVYEQWVRITSCLQRAGAASPIADQAKPQYFGFSEQVIAAFTEAALDPRQPPAEWFSSLSLYPDDRWTGLIPGYCLLTIEPSLRVRQRALDTWGRRGDTHSGRQEGAPTRTFRPEYIPLAESDTHLLVHDVRPGPDQGMILELSKTDSDQEITTWKSFVHFLGDVAFALENRKPFRGYIPDLRGNTLTWVTRHHDAG